MFNSLSQQEYGEAKYGELEDRDGSQAMGLICKKIYHLKQINAGQKQGRSGRKLSKNKDLLCKDWSDMCCLYYCFKHIK